MKSTHLSKTGRYNNASIDLPDYRIWIKIEEYGVKSPFKTGTALNKNQRKNAEHVMDQAFESILEKLIQQN